MILNRKAKFDYTFEKVYQAGMQLLGTEVKAIRDSCVSFTDSFCYFQDEELFVKNLHITSSEKNYSHDPLRDRKLLLTRRELNRLQQELTKGMTIVPTKIYENDGGLLKIEIALAKGKKSYDKKESLKERDIDRQTRKELNR